MRGLSEAEINSAQADFAELEKMNTHPPTGDRVETLARKMDGRLDSYARGVDNAERFRRVVAKR